MRSVTEPSAGAAGPIPARGATGGSRRQVARARARSAEVPSANKCRPRCHSGAGSALTKGEGHNDPRR
jgi:hypothetical protein